MRRVGKTTRLCLLLMALMGVCAAAQDGPVADAEETFAPTEAPVLDLYGADGETAAAHPAAEEAQPESEAPLDEGAETEQPERPSPGPKMTGVLEALDELQGEGASADEQGASPAPTSLYQPFARGFMAFCVTLGLILVAYVLLRGKARKAPLLGGGNLGKVVGRLYLAPRVCLHFVSAGGRILVVGVTQNAISLIAEFDASAFSLEEEEGGASEPQVSEGFLTQLKANLSRHRKEEEETPSSEDAEIASIRDEIHRLQAHLWDSSSEPDDS